MTYPIFDIYIYIYILLYDDITRKEGKAHTVWQPRAVASAAEQQNPQRRHLRLGKTARNGDSEMRLGMASGKASVTRKAAGSRLRGKVVCSPCFCVRALACVGAFLRACLRARGAARRGWCISRIVSIQLHHDLSFIVSDHWHYIISYNAVHNILCRRL